MSTRTVRTLVVRFATDRSGATAIEYALIATLVSVGIVVGATALGTQLGVVFGDLADKVEDARGGGEPAD